MDQHDDETLSPRRRGGRREQTPLQRALALLVRREHSQRELMRKLSMRGISAEDAERAVSTLHDGGWQDESRFAHSLVRNRASGGYGPFHIQAELGTHGLSGDLIAEAMDAYEGDWEENARNLVMRRIGNAGLDLAKQRKIADLLARRGFPAEMIRRICTGAGQDWDDQA